ncbi:MAG: OsmC family protein [Flavobacteriales bacterium]|nr:OsmC family protein [Flavobacteriales bacterium]MBK9289299.1 OsmC family protein [Flavobacteriales bacterium]MBL0034425.1 OsmC family protein [Flavobacteriales bacterium]
MNAGTHPYALELEWRGNQGLGTSTYEGYAREHVIRIAGKPDLIGTADPMFRGDAGVHNPEDLLLAALSGCHLLTYLALCARARINVTSYRDNASGILLLTKDGGGHFTEVMLRPEVVVAEEHMLEKARFFHGEVHKYCFIARSVNFPVRCEAVVRVA